MGTDAVGGLTASATSSESIGLTAPSTAGTYYYGACVEAAAGESDTTNNCSTSVEVTVSEVEPKPTDVVQAIVDAAVETAGGLRAGGAPVTIELSTLFSFGAGGSAETTYTARSSDPELVTAETTDGQLVLTPGNPPPAVASSSLAVGAADGNPVRVTITVTAVRADEMAEVESTVDVEAAPSPTPSPSPEPEPEPLGVDIVGVPDVAVAGESYELTAQSDAESLVYAWRVAGGALTPDTAQAVVWTAPATAGVAWIHVDVTREDGATAGQSTYVRVEVPEPEPEPEPVPALPLLGQLLLALGLAGAGAMRLVRPSRRGSAGA